MVKYNTFLLTQAAYCVFDCDDVSLNNLPVGIQRVAHQSHEHLSVKENMQGLLPVELNDPVEP